MPTDDERKQVAARLREKELPPSCLCGVLGWQISCTRFGSCEECRKWHINRLADLIEPVPERTVNLTEAVDAICGEMCGDGWDWRNRAEAVVKTVAEMCGAKVVGE